MARTLTPEFDDLSAPKPRRSARLAAARPQHLHQLRSVHLPPNSLATSKDGIELEFRAYGAIQGTPLSNSSMYKDTFLLKDNCAHMSNNG